MKYYILLITTALVFSCEKEKAIQLPELSHSEITDIKDVSAAYLFYDESRPDSVELNRKNLISTTNWLINVDKRLTLKQVIPNIKFLQSKKQNAGHKNEHAKNYFTCNDTSRKNLGFIEFTDVVYLEESTEAYLSKISDLNYTSKTKVISFNPKEAISIINTRFEPFIIQSKKTELLNEIKKIDAVETKIYLNFNQNLLFQDYITYKSILLEANLDFAEISNKEFLHN